LQITITLTECALLIFLQSGVEKLIAWLGIERKTVELGSRSGAYDFSAMATIRKSI